jgi:hypothetical protein
MTVLRTSLAVVMRNFRSLMLVNLVYFGLVGAGMAYGAWKPEVHDALASSLRQGVKDALPGVTAAYGEGRIAIAAAWTLGINLLIGSFVYITVPSLLVPFSGIVTAAIRAVMWGLVFTPSLAALSVAGTIKGLLIGLLILLEGEGYVLAILGSYIHGAAVLAPASVGASTRWKAYRSGAHTALTIYPLIVAVLALAALYETTTVIFVLPMLK